MITTATDRLIATASFNDTAVNDGTLHLGIPVSTASNVFTPHCSTGKNFVITAPAAINKTAIGNLGTTRLAIRRIANAIRPSTMDGTLIVDTVPAICSINSGNSPTPAVPPISFGICIKIIVVQIPVMNPPMTGADM